MKLVQQLQSLVQESSHLLHALNDACIVYN